MLKLVYGDAAVTMKTVYKWFERFGSVCEWVEDKERSGRPSSSTSVGPVANATDVLQPSRLIVITLSPPPVWTFPRLPPGTPMSTTMREILVAKGGTMWARINR